MKQSHDATQGKSSQPRTASLLQASWSRYRRAFASARAMPFWRARAYELIACSALALPAAAQAQFPASFDLSTLDGTNGFVINGINRDDRSGWSVSGAGDINGDGIDDLIIGAPRADPNGNNLGQVRAMSVFRPD